ncbi:hypothetical protein [Nitrosovibrio tenuis]|uniref:hypothetical protein n=1 Tax=Nitrosovibrio tenuis TaxID=1233 RepID=UPI001C431E32|nr:hypothetical protein [Nitrosovibrio tenuis]
MKKKLYLNEPLNKSPQKASMQNWDHHAARNADRSWAPMTKECDTVALKVSSEVSAKPGPGSV